MAEFKDITGRKFNRLTAIRCTSKKPTRWLFKCDCGNEKIIIGAKVIGSAQNLFLGQTSAEGK